LGFYKEYFGVNDTSVILGYDMGRGETGNKKGTRGRRVVEEQKTDNEILRVTGTGRNEKNSPKTKDMHGLTIDTENKFKIVTPFDFSS